MRETSTLEAVLSSLRFDNADFTALAGPSVKWAEVLEFMDREHLTLAPGTQWESRVPRGVAQRIHTQRHSEFSPV